LAEIGRSGAHNSRKSTSIHAVTPNNSLAKVGGCACGVDVRTSLCDVPLCRVANIISASVFIIAGVVQFVGALEFTNASVVGAWVVVVANPFNIWLATDGGVAHSGDTQSTCVIIVAGNEGVYTCCVLCYLVSCARIVSAGVSIIAVDGFSNTLSTNSLAA